MKSDILNIHLTNSIQRINDSVNRGYNTAALEIWSWVVGIMGVCLGFSSHPDNWLL